MELTASSHSRLPDLRAGLQARPEIAALVAFLAIYLSWLAFAWIPGGARELQILFLAPIDALVICAALLAAKRCIRAPLLRRFWLLIALAWAAELFADLALALYDIVLDDPTFPSFADALFIAFYPLLLIALLSVPTVRGSSSQRLRIGLDCATIVVGGGAAVWYFLLGETVLGGGEDALATAVSVTYPVCDLVLLGALSLVLMRRGPEALRLPLRLIADAFVLLIVADLIYGHAQLHGTYFPGDPVDTLYVLMPIPFVIAAATQRGTASEDPAGSAVGSAEPSLRSARLPLAATVLGFGILLATQRQDKFFPDLSLLLFAIALAGLVTARQYFAQRELVDVQERLRESEQRFRGIFDGAGVGITFSSLADGPPRVIDVNPAFERMLGYSLEEMRGDDFSLITPADDRADLAEIGTAVAAGTDRIAREQRCMRKDGSLIWASLTISIIRDERGEPRFAIGMLEDITRRKEAEQVKNEFVSVVGHELRTPLTSIRGSLGLLEGGAMGEIPRAASEMLTTAVTNTDRLVRMVNEVLDIERIDSGEEEIETTTVPVADLVGQSIEVVRPVADEAAVTIDGEADEDLAVAADADRIVQTLTNLLGNAIKFSPRGSTVRISTHGDGGTVVFTVADEGRGIPPDKLESIFERFSQVDSSDSRERGGTGLGLAIARRIVEQHGGRIWAESNGEAGARLTFTLPLVAGRPRGRG